MYMYGYKKHIIYMYSKKPTNAVSMRFINIKDRSKVHIIVKL